MANILKRGVVLILGEVRPDADIVLAGDADHVVDFSDVRGDVPSPVNTPSGCRYHPRCPYAEGICRESEPALTEVRSGQLAACHFPGLATP